MILSGAAARTGKKNDKNKEKLYKKENVDIDRKISIIKISNENRNPMYRKMIRKVQEDYL